MPDGCPPDVKLRRIAAYYRDFGGYVGRVLQRCGVREDELEDAIQETFLVAYRRIDDFEGRAAVRTWLYAIAIRVASTMRRSRNREDARRTKAGADVMSTGAPDPEVAVANRQAQAVLDALLDELDEPKRVVFVLSELEGLRIPEVARILGVNVNTVHSRLRLARQRFDAALQRHHAQEAGRRTRAQWIRHARRERVGWTEPARRHGWAALALRLEQNPVPCCTGWEALALPAHSAVTSWPAWLAGSLATVGLGATIGWTAADSMQTERLAATPSAVVEAPAREAAPAGADLPASPPRTEELGPAIAEEITPREPASRSKAPRPVSAPEPASAAEKASADAHATAETSPEVLALETALLQRARQALQRQAPDVALAALDEHASRYPRGVLALERESSRIHALCLAGRREEAAALATRLSHSKPSSRWDRILAARCGSPAGS